jgi:hypothetical protein
VDGSALAAAVAALSASAGEAPARLCGICVDVLAVTGAAVSLVSEGQYRGVAAASDRTVEAIEDMQFALGEGPGLEAYARRGPVLVPDVAAGAGRWPEFTRQALDAEVGALFCFPLQVGGARIGVLTLYRDAAGELDGRRVRDALTMAHLATEVVLALQAGVLTAGLAWPLQGVVDHRAEVHQATGMIAAQLGTGVAEALARLRAHAWAEHRSMADLSADVVAGRVSLE